MIPNTHTVWDNFTIQPLQPFRYYGDEHGPYETKEAEQARAAVEAEEERVRVAEERVRAEAKARVVAEKQMAEQEREEREEEERERQERQREEEGGEERQRGEEDSACLGDMVREEQRMLREGGGETGQAHTIGMRRRTRMRERKVGAVERGGARGRGNLKKVPEEARPGECPGNRPRKGRRGSMAPMRLYLRTRMGAGYHL